VRWWSPNKVGALVDREQRLMRDLLYAIAGLEEPHGLAIKDDTK
jgi:hypothetical protein